MQKKISLFFLICFLSIVHLFGNSESITQVPCIAPQDGMMDDGILDDDISLEELESFEKEIIQDQPAGFSYQEKLQLLKFAAKNPSITFDLLKQQSDDARKKVNQYFDTHKRAYAITVTSGVLIILLALAFKIITEDQTS